MDLSCPRSSRARDAYHLPREDSVGSRFEHPKSSGTLAVSEGAPPGPRIARPVPQEGLSRLSDSRPESPAPAPVAPPVTCLQHPSRCQGARHSCTGLVFQGEHPTGPHRGPTLSSEALEQGGTCSLGTSGKRRLVSLCRGRETVAGWCLTEESRQAVAHSGPWRNGVPNPPHCTVHRVRTRSACEHTRGSL